MSYTVLKIILPKTRANMKVWRKIIFVMDFLPETKKKHVNRDLTEVNSGKHLTDFEWFNQIHTQTSHDLRYIFWSLMFTVKRECKAGV